MSFVRTPEKYLKRLCVTTQAPFAELYFSARVYGAPIDPRRVRDRTARDAGRKGLLAAPPRRRRGFHPSEPHRGRAREIENDRGCTRACVVPLVCKKKNNEEGRKKERRKDDGDGEDGEAHVRGGGKKRAPRSLRW